MQPGREEARPVPENVILSEATPPPESLQGRTVWIVDTHALIHQVFHALPEMTSPDGRPVGAVYGLARDLLYLLLDKQPDYLFCALDLPGKTFRHEMYEPYKVQRKEMPEDLVPQIALAGRMIGALGIPALGCPGYEADDVMATVARLTEELGGECIVVTSDKDCRQLITPRVRLYNIRKDRFLDRDALIEDWGIEPRQVVDFQALVGDSVDNVPGVPLIGPKIAGQLLGQYDTLDNLLEHATEVKGKKRSENLASHREQALLSRDLVRLDAEVPVAIDWLGGRVKVLDAGPARALFSELGFRGISTRLDELAGRTEKATPPDWEPTYHTVDTPEKLDALIARLEQQESFSFDSETTHLWPRWAEPVGFSFSFDDDEAHYVPLRAPEGEPRIDPAAAVDKLRPVLEDPSIGKLGQNLKYDAIVLRGVGVELRGIGFDTMVASYLLDAGRRNHNLDDLALRYLGLKKIATAEVIGSGRNQRRMDEVPVEQVAEYAGEDAVVPWRLRPILQQRLAETELEELFTELELPLIDVLVEIEHNGIAVDTERLAALSRRYGERLETIEQEIYRLAGHELNIASPKQLQQVLFTELGLPVVKKTAKTGPSTDADVLEELAAAGHELPAKILQYRQYAKLKSTYVDALPRLVHPETGRVHASFNQVVAATGRLSSSDPNLQNIPIRTEEGREIRAAFVPGEANWSLLAADYSQIELRVLAHLSGDERMCDAFARDEDIHARVAAEVAGVGLDDVSPEMRRKAKAVNFGIIYGQSAYGLARSLGIERDEAAAFIDNYFRQYPGIDEFFRQVLAGCRGEGFVRTLLGRRRAISGIRADAERAKNMAERTAVNTVIQGSAADLIKLAMIAVHRRMKQEHIQSRMLLQIHDELVFEIPSEEMDPMRRLVAEEMADVRQLSVPLKVDVKVGPNWAEAM